MESPREARGKPRELKAAGAERGRYFRKEGLISMSCVAEVSHKGKREHVLCPLDLAARGCW